MPALADVREDFYHSRIRQFGPNYADFDLPTTEALVNLTFTYDLLHQCTARYMTGFGLSKSTLNILLVLRHGPAEGMLLHDLGEMLLVSRANITGLIDHLEEKGYVIRVIDVSDRRARFARITKKAEVLLDDFMPVHQRKTGFLLQDLTGDDKQELVRLLTKMRASARAYTDSMERSDAAETD